MPVPEKISQSSSRSTEYINNVEYIIITTALDTTGGHDTLLWTPPQESNNRHYILQNYSVSYLSGDLYTLTADIVEEFV